MRQDLSRLIQCQHTLRKVFFQIFFRLLKLIHMLVIDTGIEFY